MSIQQRYPIRSRITRPVSPKAVVSKGPITGPGEVAARVGEKKIGSSELTDLSDLSSVGSEKISGLGPSAAAASVVSPPGVEPGEKSVGSSDESLVRVAESVSTQLLNVKEVSEEEVTPSPSPQRRSLSTEHLSSMRVKTDPDEDLAILGKAASRGQTVAEYEHEPESVDSGDERGVPSEYLKGKGIDP